MTAHELARKLLECPDAEVFYTDVDGNQITKWAPHSYLAYRDKYGRIWEHAVFGEYQKEDDDEILQIVELT